MAKCSAPSAGRRARSRVFIVVRVQQESARFDADGAAWFFAEYRARPQPAFVERLVERLRLSKQDRVLDLGAGAAAIALLLAPSVREVVVVDQRADVLVEGAERAARAGVDNVRFIEGGPRELTKLALYGTFKLATLSLASSWLAHPDDLLAGLAPLIDETEGGLAFLGSDAENQGGLGAANEPLYGWRSRLAQLLEQFSPGSLASARAETLRPSLTELFAHSAFVRVERLRAEYEAVEQPCLQSAIGLLYSYAGVLDRLGHRRAVFERVAKDELGWVDRLPKVSVKRADVAVLARRAD